MSVNGKIWHMKINGWSCCISFRLSILTSCFSVLSFLFQPVFALRPTIFSLRRCGIWDVSDNKTKENHTKPNLTHFNFRRLKQSNIWNSEWHNLKREMEYHHRNLQVREGAQEGRRWIIWWVYLLNQRLQKSSRANYIVYVEGVEAWSIE